MKKIYFLAASLMMSAGVMAQTTSIITNHFEGAIDNANPANSNVGVYSWQGGNGYVAGTNSFGDKAVLQLFDSNYGITGSGTVDKLAVMINSKNDAGDGTEVSVGVWANNNGTPGALLGSVDVAISDIDTTVAGLQFILDGTILKGFYNVEVTFATPIEIPASQSFFAGITIPAGDQAAAGDTLVVLTTVMPGYTFADASTHAGTLSATNGFDSYGSASINIANAIFPTVTVQGSSASLFENELVINAYPNPADEVLNISMSETAVAVKVISMDGKVVASEEVNGTTAAINVAGLNSGVYFYEVTAANGNVVRNSFVKK